MAAFENETAFGTLSVAQAAAGGQETKGANVSLDMDGAEASVRVVLSGVFTATTSTVVFEQTVDGVNWFSLNMTPPASATPVTGATGTGSAQSFFGCCSATNRVRVRCNLYHAGDAISVLLRTSMAPYVIGA